MTLCLRQVAHSMVVCVPLGGTLYTLDMGVANKTNMQSQQSEISVKSEEGYCQYHIEVCVDSPEISSNNRQG